MSALQDSGHDAQPTGLAPPVLVTPPSTGSAARDLDVPAPPPASPSARGSNDLDPPIVDEHRQIAEMKAPAVRSPSGAATPTPAAPAVADVEPQPQPAPEPEASTAARLAPPVLRLPAPNGAPPDAPAALPMPDAPAPTGAPPAADRTAPLNGTTPRLDPQPASARFAAPASRVTAPPTGSAPLTPPAARVAPVTPTQTEAPAARATHISAVTTGTMPVVPAANGTAPVPVATAPRVTLGSTSPSGRSTITAPINFATAERVRQAHAGPFAQRYGAQLDLLPFVARAVCDALLAVPALNGNAPAVHLALSTYGNHQNPGSWPVIPYADYRTLSMIGLESAMPGFREAEPTFVLATGEVPLTDLAVLTVRVSPSTRETDTVSLTWNAQRGAPHEAEKFVERVRTTIDTHNWAIEF